MPKINVYVPDDLAASIRDAQLPVSAICQAALERAVRDIGSVRGSDQAPADDEPIAGPFARFTPRARQSLSLAEQAARRAAHKYVATEHMLLGILDEGTNLAVKVLESLDINLTDLHAALMSSMGAASTSPKGPLPFTPLSKRALESATKEALGLAHNYIGCEHLLLGLLETEEGLASGVMRRMGIEMRSTRRAVVATLGAVHHEQAQPAVTISTVESMLEVIIQRLDSIEERLAS